MKQVFKYSIIIYVSLTYVIVYNVANFFILKSDPKIYSLVPQDANQVIEVNVKNFIIKTTDQFFNNQNYVLAYLDGEEKSKLGVVNKTESLGIDLTSKLIVFSELWENETVWYCVLGLDDGAKFSKFADNQSQIIKYEIMNDFVICLLTNVSQQESVFKHLKQIANHKIKSFDSKIDLSSTFNAGNEINYYVSPNDNEYIIDGLLAVNFGDDEINFEGEYNTVGSLHLLNTISQPVDFESVLSLRTTFNYFDDIPGFNEMSVDYKSTDFIASNALIPIHVAPNLNMFVSSEKSDYKVSFFDKIDRCANFKVDSISQQLTYLNQLSFSVGYKLEGSRFVLSNDSLILSGVMNEKINSDHVLELNIKPDLYFSKVNFVNDELNPPKMIAGLKVGMFKNIVTEFSTINKVEKVYCSVKYAENKTKLISKGEVKFKEKYGHSVVESMFMSINVLKAIETFSQFQ